MKREVFHNTINRLLGSEENERRVEQCRASSRLTMSLAELVHFAQHDAERGLQRIVARSTVSGVCRQHIPRSLAGNGAAGSLAS